MLHQCLADRAIAALDQGKDTFWHVAFFNRGMHGLGHDLARAGVGGVPFYDDRTSCGQRCGGVAPGGGKGQREVRRAEDGDRANRALDHAQLRAGQGLPVGQGWVDPRIKVVAL